ncbi:MAG: hypothetical protein SGVNAXEH_000528 [Holophagaceae bacterium]|jgi:hypothetical protein
MMTQPAGVSLSETTVPPSPRTPWLTSGQKNLILVILLVLLYLRLRRRMKAKGRRCPLCGKSHLPDALICLNCSTKL